MRGEVSFVVRSPSPVKCRSAARAAGADSDWNGVARAEATVRDLQATSKLGSSDRGTSEICPALAERPERMAFGYKARRRRTARLPESDLQASCVA